MSKCKIDTLNTKDLSGRQTTPRFAGKQTLTQNKTRRMRNLSKVPEHTRVIVGMNLLNVETGRTCPPIHYLKRKAKRM